MRGLHRLLQALHPPRHKRRHRAAVEALLDELLRRAPDDVARNRVLRRALRDALRTLCRSWGDVLWRRARPAQLRRRGAWDSLRSDLGFAVRFHRRRPIHALVTVVTLALAVGANTAVYSVAEATLFRSLPYRDPDRIVELRGLTRGLFTMTGSLAWSISRTLDTAAGIEAAGLYVAGGGANLVAGAPASRLTLTPVSDNFFRILGVDLALGTGFSAANDSDVAVIAHSVWVQTFGSDPAVLGRTIRLSDIPYRIVGVAPPQVHFPGDTEIWVRQPVHWGFFSDAAGPTLIARLTPGASRPQVQALLSSRVREALGQSEVSDGKPPATTLVPLRDTLTESVRAPLFVLMGAAAMVFLLGCLNLAGVAVARLVRRIGELDIRRALGAGRARVFRQLLVEALVLGALGGLTGVVFAILGVRMLLAWLPGDVPGLATAGVGPSATVLAALLATVAALIINALPALGVVRRLRIEAALRTATENRQRARLRSALAVAQVTLAVLLLIAAGLLGKTLTGLARTPLGIDIESVLTFEVHVTQPPREGNETDEQFDTRVRARAHAHLQQLLARLRRLPSVSAVGAASQLPLSHDMVVFARIRAPEASEETGVYVRSLEATPAYFDAMGIRFLGGRSPSPRTTSGRREIVVSREAAESLFATVDAAGREALYRVGRDWEPVLIAGVVEDVRFSGPESDSTPAVYAPLGGSYDSRFGFAVRVAGDPRGIVEQVTRAVVDVDPTVPPFNVQTTRQALSRELATRQALAVVSSLFAVMAMLLACVGIYGLIAEGVARRRREIGIRIALGAPIGALVRAVTGRGLALAVVGTVGALPLALWGGGLLDNVLFGVSSTDTSVLVAAPVLLLAVAGLAAWLPARRAARIDPAEVLSTE